MSDPLVSVCITTYNHQSYIKDCVMSVLSQEIDVRLEILIGDDNSSDATCEVIKGLILRYPESIRYFVHKPNLGPSGNLQFLIRQAAGQYIAHLDGDDHWLPGKLAAQLDFMQRHPECVACFTNAIVVNDARELSGVFTSNIPVVFDLAFLLRKGNFLNHSSLFYRAEYKKMITSFSGPFIDYLIHVGLAQYGRLGFIRAALVVYRFGSVNSMVKTTPETVFRLYFEALVSVKVTDPVLIRARASAFADLLSEILLSSIQSIRAVWALRWVRDIYCASVPKGGQVVATGILLSIFKGITRAWNSALRRISSAGSQRIFYER